MKSVLPDSIVSISMFCDLFIEARFDFSPSPPPVLSYSPSPSSPSASFYRHVSQSICSCSWRFWTSMISVYDCGNHHWKTLWTGMCCRGLTPKSDSKIVINEKDGFVSRSVIDWIERRLEVVTVGRTLFGTAQMAIDITNCVGGSKIRMSYGFRSVRPPLFCI